MLFLYKKATAFEGLAQYKLKVEIIKILLEVDDGVIEAVKLVVIGEVEVVAYVDDVVPCTTCKTLPADACVAEPVAVATGYVMPVSPFKISAMSCPYANNWMPQPDSVGHITEVPPAIPPFKST